MSDRQIAEGRWVNTIVYELWEKENISTCFCSLGSENSLTLTFPNRLAMEEATSIDAAETMLVVKKMEPSWPSGSENLRLKKYVIQDLSP